jgi:hypothetical protein
VTAVYADAGAATTDATLAGTRNLVCPATVNAGDLLIAQNLVRNSAGNGTVVCNDGTWTAFAGNPYESGVIAKQGLHWKIADGSEDAANISFTMTGSTTNDLHHGRIYRFTSVDGFAATPIAAISTASAVNATLSAPTVTPTGVNQLAVLMIAVAGPISVGSITGESGGDWTLQVRAETTTGGDGTIAVQTSDQSGGGAVSGGSVNVNNGTSVDWSAVGFVLVPGVPGQPTVKRMGAVPFMAINRGVF